MAEIAASHYGFFDVDVADNDPGGYRLVASASNRKVTARGKTMKQAVERLMDIFRE